VQRPIKRLLVANRGEIALRIFRAARDLDIGTIAVYAAEDRSSRHVQAANESHEIGRGGRPVDAYLDIDELLRVARATGADAVHPGYGFLSESPSLAEACEAAGIVFIGPRPETLRLLGDKVAARALAQRAGLPVLPGTRDVEPESAADAVVTLGLPVLVKAAWGGGGRGMRRITSIAEAATMVDAARREAHAAFGNGEVYLEKLLSGARHVEVQILGDMHGNIVHLYERDCTVQRRHQKIVEQAPAPWLSESERHDLCAMAVRIGKECGYAGAGTVEFLVNPETRAVYFIEVNPRIQVEHTVTEEITGLDIVRAQIRIAEGAALGSEASGVPGQSSIRMTGFAIQCRVTAESPAAGFAPSHGRITQAALPAGPGVRVDGASVWPGAVVSPAFDSLLAKIIVRGADRNQAAERMRRALDETRIGGIETNIGFLRQVLSEPAFLHSTVHTTWVDELRHRPDSSAARAAMEDRPLAFLAEVIVHRHPDLRGRASVALAATRATLPCLPNDARVAPGTRQLLQSLGPKQFSRWMRDERRLLITDTTVREAQQSLLATRLRTHDIVAAMPHYAGLLPELLSIECWGGATFDVMLRYLREDPWHRVQRIRAAVPNVLLQMMLRGANAVGYSRYPQPVIRRFVIAAVSAGIDVFRIFDALNIVDNMRGAMDAVIEAGGLCEPTLCYTGDLFDSDRPKWNLRYYVERARALERAGADVLAIKDMAGICRPIAAAALVRALREEVGIPIQFNGHDTGGLGVATALAAAEAGVDAVDCALDALSGITSQPMLGAILRALEGTERDPRLAPAHVLTLSRYFDDVRRQYAPFEIDLRAGTSEVFRHEMPGGQYTNLREQARALGLADRWPEIASRYEDVNRLFGDIVKITPTSKIVADLALFMVMRDLSPEDVLDPDQKISFPASVVSLLRGDLGTPDEGFPPALCRKVLGRGTGKNDARTDVSAADIDAAEREAAQLAGGGATEFDVLSYLMFPDVFREYRAHFDRFGEVWRIPTAAYYHGMRPGEEIEIERDGTTALHVRLLGSTHHDDGGADVQVLFEVDGELRVVGVAPHLGARPPGQAKARDDRPGEIGAPMPGQVVRVGVQAGQLVEKGQPIVWMEAMKMQSEVIAACSGRVAAVHVSAGDMVGSRDLLVTLE
jgi:pyruvate carboxylase